MVESKKILIVDDDPHIVNLLTMLLHPCGYTVFPANDGIEGIKIIKEQKPDLVIVDLMMPGLDGYHLLYQVVFEEPEITVPKIIVISSRSGVRDQDLAQRVGADIFIHKPFDIKEIVAAVKQLLGGAA